MTPLRPRSKYHAQPTIVHGFRFASQAEARRYGELLLLGRAGELRNLELQPRFPITSGGAVVAVYVADFRYEEQRFGRTWHDVVEDVKGVQTPVYKLKKRLVEAQYGIQIRETR